MEDDIQKELKGYSSRQKAKILQRFFKTGKGDYGEGDLFLGISVPDIRKVCKKYFKNISFRELDTFLKSEFHEYRLFGLLTLTYMYEKGDEELRKEIFEYYLNNRRYVNNWDLIDTTAPKIVGEYIKNHSEARNILDELVVSDNLWDQRIAVLSTFAFLKDEDFDATLKFAKMLLNHEHDLMHKAVGWMLREVGKRDEKVLKEFLNKYYKRMPRTMLRYSIERFDKDERLRYLERL